MGAKPTHEQAQLHLKVYDLRREPRLREARDWFLKHYFVETLDDATRIAGPGTEGGVFAGMVMGYWEQACALLNYGLLHEDLFFKTSGEFFGVWERLGPIVPEARERFVYKQFLAHMESAAKRFESWTERRSPGHIAAMRQFMEQMNARLTSGGAKDDRGLCVTDPVPKSGGGGYVEVRYHGPGSSRRRRPRLCGDQA